MKFAHLAVVRIHCSFSIEPAQKWEKESCTETIQGNSPNSASQQLGQWGTRPGRNPHSAEGIHVFNRLKLVLSPPLPEQFDFLYFDFIKVFINFQL